MRTGVAPDMRSLEVIMGNTLGVIIASLILKIIDICYLNAALWVAQAKTAKLEEEEKRLQMITARKTIQLAEAQETIRKLKEQLPADAASDGDE